MKRVISYILWVIPHIQAVIELKDIATDIRVYWQGSNDPEVRMMRRRLERVLERYE
tara:strand:+ start:633 stop:800 length:168 start_codon:yes stop_codon:yes gene_type:complete